MGALDVVLEMKYYLECHEVDGLGLGSESSVSKFRKRIFLDVVHDLTRDFLAALIGCGTSGANG
jgi:hypothetical protein